MTPEQIIYERRRRLIELAGQVGVSEACRLMGISRTGYYRWAQRARRYGLAALMPKARRRPQMPNATPHETVEAVLCEAVCRPTLGARQLADHLHERGIGLSASGVRKILARHNLARRAQRVGALAQITAAETGLMSEHAKDGPFGFCHFAARPGDLVALDTFCIGRLKGIGAVWQLTAIDTATRLAVATLTTGAKSAQAAVGFIDVVAQRLAELGVPLRRVLTDNGPEFTRQAFTEHLENAGIAHTRIPPRSPNHNAVCERFQGTALQECRRPAFHRRRFDRLSELEAELDAWIDRYNHRRKNHGDFMRGRTPAEVLATHMQRTP